MRVPTVLYQGLGLLLACQSALAASTAWTFTDATLTVQGKGSGVGSGLKEKYADGFDGMLAILTSQVTT